jgi:hypothetical protein
MYMFGCSKQWQTEYTSTSKSVRLHHIQSVINYVFSVYKLIYHKILKYCSSMPNALNGGCGNCGKHILNLHNFYRGVFTYDYFAPAHKDKDKSFTIFLTLWPYGGSGGEFFHAGVGSYFTMKHGDVLIFNGTKIHGSAKCSNTTQNEKKITIGLFN